MINGYSAERGKPAKLVLEKWGWGVLNDGRPRAFYEVYRGEVKVNTQTNLEVVGSEGGIEIATIALDMRQDSAGRDDNAVFTMGFIKAIVPDQLIQTTNCVNGWLSTPAKKDTTCGKLKVSYFDAAYVVLIIADANN